MIPKIQIEQPSLGNRGNWNRISSRIKCWADAVGAMVFRLGDESVLAQSADDAVATLAEEVTMKELASVQAEIRSLESRIGDLEDEIESLQEEEKRLVDAQKMRRSLLTKEDAEWLKNQLTLPV